MQCVKRFCCRLLVDCLCLRIQSCVTKSISISLGLSSSTYHVHCILHSRSARIQAVRPVHCSLYILTPSILAANRDEYLDRPATPAGWHDFGDAPSQGDMSDQAWVLSGRDTSSSIGGTWLGMTSDLRIGAMYVHLLMWADHAYEKNEYPISTEIRYWRYTFSRQATERLSLAFSLLLEPTSGGRIPSLPRGKCRSV
jgi:hypothetical protein